MKINYVVILVAFFFVILVSIQYTLLQILSEIRRIREKNRDNS